MNLAYHIIHVIIFQHEIMILKLQVSSIIEKFVVTTSASSLFAGPTFHFTTAFWV